MATKPISGEICILETRVWQYGTLEIERREIQGTQGMLNEKTALCLSGFRRDTRLCGFFLHGK